MEARALTVAEFAGRYAYRTQTVYAMIDRGDLGCIRRPGCSIRILPKHIEEWEARFECPARRPQTRIHTSSESEVGALGTSDGRSQGQGAVKPLARGVRMRAKLASLSQRSKQA